MKNPMIRLPVHLVFVVFLLNLLASTPATAQGPSAFPADKTAKIEAAITTVMSRQNIPGLSIAIVTDNQLRWQGGYGMADVENFVPAKALTVYRIASTSKPLTAVAAMQLAEKGKLDLDAPVQKYAPSFPTKNFPITTRQLLAHLSGIRHYNPAKANAPIVTKV